jgi:hypothetical protein
MLKSNFNFAAKEDLANIIAVKHVLGTRRYIGLSSMVGGSKKTTFTYI